MWLGVTELSAPAVEPITVDEARLQCRIDGTGPDPQLTSFITAARQRIESLTELCLVNRVVTLKATGWSDLRRLPVAPLQQVVSVSTQVGSADPIAIVGLEQRLGGIFPSFAPAGGACWPTLPAGAVIVIQAVAGYGEAAAAVPELLRLAIKMLVSAMNDGRGAISEDAERSIASLLRPFHRPTA